MLHSTMPKVRRRMLHEGDPEERLLAAATELFTCRGYASTSVREIVERAGVTKPVLYYHFGSKEGIYRALSRRLFDDFESRLDEGRESRGSARERMVSLCTGLFDLVGRRRAAVRFLYGVYYGPPESAPPFDISGFLGRFRAMISDALAAGVESSEVMPERAAELATGIEAALKFAIEAVLSEPQLQFSSSDLVRLINLLFYGASPDRQIRSTTLAPIVQETES